MFFPLLFKKYNKLDEYIYTYFFIICFFLYYLKIIVRIIKKSNKHLYFYFSSKPKFHKKKYCS